MLSFSLFVLLKGATKEQAFTIGKDIVDTVTAMNPKPVKLKFEKVWLSRNYNCRKSRKFTELPLDTAVWNSSTKAMSVSLNWH